MNHCRCALKVQALGHAIRTKRYPSAQRLPGEILHDPLFTGLIATGCHKNRRIDLRASQFILDHLQGDQMTVECDDEIVLLYEHAEHLSLGLLPSRRHFSKQRQHFRVSDNFFLASGLESCLINQPVREFAGQVGIRWRPAESCHQFANQVPGFTALDPFVNSINLQSLRRALQMLIKRGPR